MGPFALRAGAALVAAATFVGANAYVLAHPKNSAAPLQPPAGADIVLRPSVTPGASAAPSGKPLPATPARPTARAGGQALPQITLQPGVRATAIPGITYTHVS